MRARRERARERLGREHRADREAAAEALRERDRVGARARPVVAEEASEPADAGLHLVDEQQRAVLVAERAKPREEPARRGEDAALALHRLDDDRRDVGPIAAFTASRSPYATCVTPPTSPKPSRYFGVPVIESAPIVRPWNALWNAMIRVALRVALAVEVAARELEERLVRLRARVAEERAVEARALAELVGEEDVLLVVEVVRHVHDAPACSAIAVDERRVRVADGAHRDAGAEVEPAVAVDVEELAAAPRARTNGAGL